MYKVLPFIITNYNEISVIQNSLNTVIIESKEMINFFNWVDSNSEYNISSNEINSYFGIQTDEAIEFMKSNNLIDDIRDKIIEFEDIVIVSNDEVFLDSMKFNCNGKNEKFIFQKLPNSAKDFKINYPKNLYIFFMNPFNYRYYYELVQIVKEKNVLSRFSFYYNHNIFLLNYYKNEWFNPCPLCFFGNLETTLRENSKLLNIVSFQTIIDLIYKKHPQFNIEYSFNNYNILILISAILNEIDITNNTYINNIQYIDFNKNTIVTDQSIYWEFCDCYE